jgi:hypothetical protein
MMLRVKRADYVGEYKLKLAFSDGKTKIVDFKDWINEGGVYATPLRDAAYFKQVKMDEFNYSICWANGADFSPDALYEAGREVQEQKKKKRPWIRKSRNLRERRSTSQLG